MASTAWADDDSWDIVPKLNPEDKVEICDIVPLKLNLGDEVEICDLKSDRFVQYNGCFAKYTGLCKNYNGIVHYSFEIPRNGKIVKIDLKSCNFILQVDNNDGCICKICKFTDGQKNAFNHTVTVCTSCGYCETCSEDSEDIVDSPFCACFNQNPVEFVNSQNSCILSLQSQLDAALARIAELESLRKPLSAVGKSFVMPI